MINDNQPRKLEQLDRVIDHPIGAHAYTAACLDQLDPLLQKAAEEMRSCGINLESFYR